MGDAAHTLSLRGIITNHNELGHIHPASFIRSIFNRHGTIDMEAFSLGTPGLPPPRAKTISGLIADGRLFMEAIHRYQVALGSG